MQGKRSNYSREPVAASLRDALPRLLTREMYASHTEAATGAAVYTPNEIAFLGVIPIQARDIPLSVL